MSAERDALLRWIARHPNGVGHLELFTSMDLLSDAEESQVEQHLVELIGGNAISRKRTPRGWHYTVTAGAVPSAGVDIDAVHRNPRYSTNPAKENTQ